MNTSTFGTIKYMNRSVFFKGHVYEWGRFRNTGTHIRTTITPKLPTLPTSATVRDWSGVAKVYLTSPGRPNDIGLQLGKACYPCSR